MYIFFSVARSSEFSPRYRKVFWSEEEWEFKAENDFGSRNLHVAHLFTYSRISSAIANIDDTHDEVLISWI